MLFIKILLFLLLFAGQVGGLLLFLDWFLDWIPWRFWFCTTAFGFFVIFLCVILLAGEFFWIFGPEIAKLPVPEGSL